MNHRGQSLVEFALVLPLLIALLGGVLQFGVMFFAQHALTQVGRDAGRWAATQQFDPCSGSDAQSAIAARAEAFAQQSGLFGYSAGKLNVGTSWSTDSGTCPPTTAADVTWVRVTLSYEAPSFVPWMNNVTLSTSSMFRMEPKPQT